MIEAYQDDQRQLQSASALESLDEEVMERLIVESTRYDSIHFSSSLNLPSNDLLSSAPSSQLTWPWHTCTTSAPYCLLSLTWTCGPCSRSKRTRMGFGRGR
jgi:hypothetical protein